jgi:hypothetical protein
VYFLQLYSALAKTFHTMRDYAQKATHTEAPSQKVITLENEFTGIGEELEATVDAIIIRAVFSEHNEQKWDTLTHSVHEVMAFIQAITSDADITPEWLAKRDALAVRMVALLKGASPIEEEIRQWLHKDGPASAHLLETLALN